MLVVQVKFKPHDSGSIIYSNGRTYRLLKLVFFIYMFSLCAVILLNGWKLHPLQLARVLLGFDVTNGSYLSTTADGSLSKTCPGCFAKYLSVWSF